MVNLSDSDLNEKRTKQILNIKEIEENEKNKLKLTISKILKSYNPDSITVSFVMEKIRDQLQVDKKYTKENKPLIKKLIVEKLDSSECLFEKNDESIDIKKSIPSPVLSIKTHTKRSTINTKEKTKKKKIKIDKNDDQNEKDSEITNKKDIFNKHKGINLLKRLCKEAGLLSPKIFILLKNTDYDIEKCEDILRSILKKNNINFKNDYPTEKEIYKVKKKKDMQREMEDIDISAIVRGSRKRTLSYIGKEMHDDFRINTNDKKFVIKDNYDDVSESEAEF